MSFQLRRGGVIGGASVGALALVTVGAGLAGAQATGSISVSPGTGAPGTTISVSGDGCHGTSVALLLVGDGTVDDGSASPDGDGAWSGTLVADEELVDPGDTLTITANCLGGDVNYESGTFQVTGTSPTTTLPSTTTTSTTTTAPPATTTTTEPGPGDPDPTEPPPASTTTQPAPPAPAPVPAPAPAAPVEDQPDYAG
jgi:cell division septation protein DedD